MINSSLLLKLLHNMKENKDYKVIWRLPLMRSRLVLTHSRWSARDTCLRTRLLALTRSQLVLTHSLSHADALANALATRSDTLAVLTIIVCTKNNFKYFNFYLYFVNDVLQLVPKYFKIFHIALSVNLATSRRLLRAPKRPYSEIRYFNIINTHCTKTHASLNDHFNGAIEPCIWVWDYPVYSMHDFLNDLHHRNPRCATIYTQKLKFI